MNDCIVESEGDYHASRKAKLNGRDLPLNVNSEHELLVRTVSYSALVYLICLSDEYRFAL